MQIKARTKVGRRPRKIVQREPIGVSVKEALMLVPVGRSSLYKAMQSGVLKSRKVLGIRIIDYPSLKALAAGETEK
jgi:hypothetical protein